MTTTTTASAEIRIRGMTCGACATRVARALTAVPGVQQSHVDVGHASVTYDPEQTSPAVLEAAIRQAGYTPIDPIDSAPCADHSVDSSRGASDRLAESVAIRSAPVSARRERLRVSPVVWGMLGMMGLVLLYGGIVGGASRSFDHVIELLATDWPFVAALAVGFGIQVGLYAHLRGLARSATAGTATATVGTGTSTVAMIACCAHHATDVLPILGLSAVASTAGFLAEWRVPLMVLGIVSNLVGIALTLYFVGRAKRHVTAMSSGAACH